MATSTDRKFMEPKELRERLQRGEKLFLVDVRSSEEFEAGHVENAINIPGGHLAARASELPTDIPVVTVCSLGGARSCEAADLLQGLGYSSALPLRGGTRGWQNNHNQDREGSL